MILAKRKDAKDYCGIHPLLDRALACLDDAFLESVGMDGVQIDGKNLYASLNQFETLPDEKLFFEAHREYLDIHVPLAGEERMDIADTALLTPDEAASKPENDFYAFSDKAPEHQSAILKPGDFLVAFPADAHRVKGQVSGASAVRKLVFKIRIGS